MSPKETLREAAKKLLANTNAEEFCSQGNGAAALLRSSPVWSRYRTVFLFLSMKAEIETLPLVDAALNDGKKVFVPRVQTEGLVFYPIFSTDGPWQRGPFGIREPAIFPKEKSAAPRDFPALIIAPGLAFDREGNRLGRGKAYYDRFFAKLDGEDISYTALGLCMDFQIVPRVPVEETDKKMDGFLTGTELFKVKSKR